MPGMLENRRALDMFIAKVYLYQRYDIKNLDSRRNSCSQSYNNVELESFTGGVVASGHT